LNASSSVSQVTIEESDVEGEATGEDEEGEEDSNISPGITPI
jgi:hypothetical protein